MKDKNIITPRQFMEELRRYQKGSVSRRHFLGVTGLSYTGNRANDVIAFLLQALVVVPTLIACAFWVWGFRERPGVGE